MTKEQVDDILNEIRKECFGKSDGIYSDNHIEALNYQNTIKNILYKRLLDLSTN